MQWVDVLSLYCIDIPVKFVLHVAFVNFDRPLNSQGKALRLWSMHPDVAAPRHGHNTSHAHAWHATRSPNVANHLGTRRCDLSA